MKIVRACIAILIAVGLTGCTGLRVRQGMDQAGRINLECRTQKLQGQFATWSEAVQCGNDRMRQVIQASGYRHMDLINLFLAYRVLLAERMDAGQLTDAEATVLLTELWTRITTEEQARDHAADHAYSQRLIGIGAAMQGLGTLNKSLQPPPPPLVVVPLGR